MPQQSVGAFNSGTSDFLLQNSSLETTLEKWQSKLQILGPDFGLNFLRLLRDLLGTTHSSERL